MSSIFVGSVKVIIIIDEMIQSINIKVFILTSSPVSVFIMVTPNYMPLLVT